MLPAAWLVQGAAPVIRQVWSRGPRAGMYPISADLTYWFVCFDDVSDALSVPLSPGGDLRKGHQPCICTLPLALATGRGVVCGWSRCGD